MARVFLCLFVAPPRIELGSWVPETHILSIVLRSQRAANIGRFVKIIALILAFSILQLLKPCESDPLKKARISLWPRDSFASRARQLLLFPLVSFARVDNAVLTKTLVLKMPACRQCQEIASLFLLRRKGFALFVAKR